MIISPMKLIKMAKKWRRQASSMNMIPTTSSFPPPTTNKGHFAVYTMEDKKRFMVPISCLDNQAFRQLLDISEEEFGPPGNGPIRLPCDGPSIEFLVSLIKRASTVYPVKALMMTCVCDGRRIASSRSSFDYPRGRADSSQPFLVSSF